MNTTMADGAEQRLDAQIAEALFGQPGMSKMDVANRVRELRGDGPALLVDGQTAPAGQIDAETLWWLQDAINTMAEGGNQSHVRFLQRLQDTLSAQPSPSSIFDLEGMLAACVPGGDITDPQVIADNIRRWFAAQPSPGGQGEVRIPLPTPGNGEWSDGWNACREAMLRGEGEALAARQPVGEPAMYQVRPRSFEDGEGWRKVTKREYDDRGPFPGYDETEWERRTLYAAPPAQQDSEQGVKLKEALAKCISHGKDLLVQLDAVTKDRDERSVRHFDELTAMRRDRDNWRGRAELSDKKQPAQAVDLGAVRDAVQGITLGFDGDLPYIKGIAEALALIDGKAVGK